METADAKNRVQRAPARLRTGRRRVFLPFPPERARGYVVAHGRPVIGK